MKAAAVNKCLLNVAIEYVFLKTLILMFVWDSCGTRTCSATSFIQSFVAEGLKVFCNHRSYISLTKSLWTARTVRHSDNTNVPLRPVAPQLCWKTFHLGKSCHFCLPPGAYLEGRQLFGRPRRYSPWGSKIKVYMKEIFDCLNCTQIKLLTQIHVNSMHTCDFEVFNFY